MFNSVRRVALVARNMFAGKVIVPQKAERRQPARMPAAPKVEPGIFMEIDHQDVVQLCFVAYGSHGRTLVVVSTDMWIALACR
jgi:hypothetical protein